MTKCTQCNRRYDSSMEFVEDYDLCAVMDYFIDIDNTCPDCVYEIEDRLNQTVKELSNARSNSTY